MVSSHFNYFEEYVLAHSPEWLFRKAKQAQKEKWETSKERVSEQVHGLMILVSSFFGKHESLEELLPPSFEDAIASTKEKKEKQGKYEAHIWWKSEPE